MHPLGAKRPINNQQPTSNTNIFVLTPDKYALI